jgi:hypothetical protein
MEIDSNLIILYKLNSHEYETKIKIKETSKNLFSKTYNVEKQGIFENCFVQNRVF